MNMSAGQSRLTTEGQFFEHIQQYVSDLKALENEPADFKVSFKDHLQAIIAGIEKLATSIEKRAEEMPPDKARKALDLMAHALKAWKEVNATIDQTVGLALRGKLEKRFLLLSPIANAANLNERVRLLRAEQRLTQALARTSLEQASSEDTKSVSDPDPVAGAHGPSVAGRKELLESLATAGVPAESGEPKESQRVTEPSASDTKSTGRAGQETVPENGFADWDQFFALRQMDEEKAFQECLARLTGVDELDRNEALADVIRRFQHLFLYFLVGGLGKKEQEIADVLQVLWQNAEILLLEDVFYSARETKLVHLLAMADPIPAAASFRKLLQIFHRPSDGYPSPEGLDCLRSADAEEREIYLRSFLIHPHRLYRQYAIQNLSPTRYWSVVSFPSAPLVALADILDSLGKKGVGADYCKIFFDCTFKRLSGVQDKAQVRIARRMLNTFFTYDFFLEDSYFRKMMKLNQHIEQLEARFKIKNPLFEHSIQKLMKEKDLAGPTKTKLPKSFAQIPLPIQRKLASEGIYVNLFIRHPNPKIALETLRFIRSPATAESVLKVRTLNGRLLAEIAKKEELVTSYSARLSLLSNPRATLKAVQRYIPNLRGADLEKLATNRDINPELREYLQARQRWRGGGRR